MRLKNILIAFITLLYIPKLEAQFNYSSLSDSSEFTTIHVGPEREIKDLQGLIEYEFTNMRIIVDEGIYSIGKELWIDGKNLIFEGEGHVELHCLELHSNVMWIMGENIIVRNFTLKHFKPGKIEGQNCTGRVIALDNAYNVLIEGCDINGCGLVGVHDNVGNENITIKNNYIHYNSLAPFGNISGDIWMEETDYHQVFHFENNRIENNGPDRIPEFEDTLTHLKFSDEQSNEIDSLKRTWSHGDEYDLYKKHKVKHDCGDCHSTTLYIELRIDGSGNIENIDVLNDYIYCLDDKNNALLKTDMIQSILNTWHFSDSFRYKVVKIRVGRLLKC